MESFTISEKFRKYLIAITLNGEKFFTVWGTDMQDNEVDKLLVNSGKLIISRKKSALKIAAKKVDKVFKDEQNFVDWLHSESFKKAYSTINADVLLSISIEKLQTRATALQVLDAMNIIQDFHYQINEDIDLLQSKMVLMLKDSIYNNFFWQKKLKSNLNKMKALDLDQVRSELTHIHSTFLKRVLIC